MSSDSSDGGNGTFFLLPGPDILQISDFYIKAGILHPLVIGSLAVLFLFTLLRLGSNRSITPITTFDWLINVALGSTLSSIVNGNSLVRGLLAILTMLLFQYGISSLACRHGGKLGGLLQGQPLVIVFRGRMLEEVMRRHRIGKRDVEASLRARGVVSLKLVEVAFIEPSGRISVFTERQLREAGTVPEVLLVVEAYRLLYEREERLRDGESGSLLGEVDGVGKDGDARSENEIAIACC